MKNEPADISHRLESSRTTLRLLTGATPQRTFPRSTTMRLLIAPEYSWVRMIALSVLVRLVTPGQLPGRRSDWIAKAGRLPALLASLARR